MNIHEYQAKELLKSYGIPVPPGEVVYSDRAGRASPRSSAAAAGSSRRRSTPAAEARAAG